MRPKIRQLLEESIENGIWHGFEKAHKHTDQPPDSQIIEEIEHYIWLYIDEQFDFEPETVNPSPRDLVTDILEGFDRLTANRNKCNDHPDAPHGFDRDSSHVMDRYVCECESWEPEDMLELTEALEEAVYLLNPTDEDMQKEAGVYRVVTALEKLKENNT